MSRLSLLAEESARENATAHDWHDNNEARALIARWLVADGVVQFLAGSHLTGAQDGLAADIEDIELSLEFFRDRRIDDEVGTLSEQDQDDDYLIDAIGESAPRVAAVLESARKDERLADVLSLAPVTRVTPFAVAA